MKRNHGPNRFDHTKGPRSGQEPVDAGQSQPRANAKMKRGPLRSKAYMTIMNVRATTPKIVRVM